MLFILPNNDERHGKVTRHALLWTSLVGHISRAVTTVTHSEVPRFPLAGERHPQDFGFPALATPPEQRPPLTRT